VKKSGLLGILGFLAAALGAVPPTPTFTPTPGGAFSLLNQAVVNCSVDAVAADAASIYLGGCFSYAGPRTGSFIVWDLAGDTLSAGWPEVQGIRGTFDSAAVPDGSGGWYLGGDFRGVAGQARSGLAHVFSNGSLDPGFNPSCDGPVRALVLSGAKLFVGGGFSNLGGQPCVDLGKLDAVSGALDTSFNAAFPPAVGSAVTCLALSGTALYLGGSFSSLSGQTRVNLAKVDALSGALDTSFRSDADAFLWTLTLTAGSLYVAGHFNHISGTALAKLAKLDPLSGLPDIAFNAQLSPTAYVRTLDFDGSYLYAGGSFAGIGGQSIPNLARLDPLSGAADASFAAGATNLVPALKLAGTKLYVSVYDIPPGSPEARGRLLRLDTGSGLYDSSFALWSGSMALSFGLAGSELAIAGGFNSVGGYPREGLVRLRSSDGQVDPTFSCDIGGAYPLNVNALALSSTALYVGGYFQSLSGLARANLGKVDALSGLPDPAFLADTDDPNPSFHYPIAGLSLANGSLYACGTFSNIGGFARGHVARLDPASGAVNPAFNPNAGGTFVQSMLASGSSLFLAGAFTGISGVAQANLAKVDASSGSLITAFAPAVDNQVTSLLMGSLGLYIGGDFGNVDGQPRLCLAKLDPSSGAVDSAFGATCGLTGSSVTCLAWYGSQLLAGGLFWSLSGQTRYSLGGLDPSSGAADSLFDPSLMLGPGSSAVVEALAFSPSGSQIYVEGAFQDEADFGELDGHAAYVLPPAPTATVTATMTASLSQTPSQTASPSASVTATISPTPSPSLTYTTTPSPSPSPTLSPSPFISATPTLSPSSSPTPPPPVSAQPYVYPQPLIGGLLHIAYPMLGPGEAEVLVYNERADLAARIKQHQGGGMQESEIDSSSFAPGVYLYSVHLSYDSGASQVLGPGKFFKAR
jgi:hypothetical protein